jgi:hypothetical protein
VTYLTYHRLGVGMCVCPRLDRARRLHRLCHLGASCQAEPKGCRSVHASAKAVCQCECGIVSGGACCTSCILPTSSPNAVPARCSLLQGLCWCTAGASGRAPAHRQSTLQLKGEPSPLCTQGGDSTGHGRWPRSATKSQPPQCRYARVSAGRVARSLFAAPAADAGWSKGQSECGTARAPGATTPPIATEDESHFRTRYRRHRRHMRGCCSTA